MERKTIPLADLQIDDNLNVREELDDETVKQYMECFDQLPPVVVFKSDDIWGYLLADGFHRFESAKRLGKEKIEAEIRQGGYKDAEEYAALANLRHGKPLTRAERRKAVERMLTLHPERADSWIAEDTGVTHKTIRVYRVELENNLGIPKLDKFIGKDGKERPREKKQPQKDKQAPDEATEQSQEAEAVEVEEPEHAASIVEPEPQAKEQPQVTEAEATSGDQATPSVKDLETEQVEETQAVQTQLCCDERFVSLDDIRGYIGKTVDVVISVGRSGPNIQKRGIILDVVERDGAFALDFKTEDGVRQQIPTGTTTGKPTDEGILEIKRIDQPAEETHTDEEVEHTNAEEVQSNETSSDHIDDETQEVPETEVVGDETDKSEYPEEWNTFNEYYDWMEEYSLELASQGDISSVRTIRMVLENLAKKLGEALEELEGEL